MEKAYKHLMTDALGIPSYMFGEGRTNEEIEVIHKKFLIKYKMI